MQVYDGFHHNQIVRTPANRRNKKEAKEKNKRKQVIHVRFTLFQRVGVTSPL